VGKETKYVTELFKNHNVDITFHIYNSFKKYSSVKLRKGDPYDHCCMYGLLCQDCGGAPVGQPERKFRTRSEEIVRDIRIK
jgi:hypothetical protein